MTFKHLPDQLWIERGGRFVKEKDFRFHCQSARNRDPLLLPAGKMSWIIVTFVGQAHFQEQLFCPKARVPFRDAKNMDRCFDNILQNSLA